jgi:DNA-directed RNA polymerase subunit M/transcription elongation factor TFIIS
MKATTVDKLNYEPIAIEVIIKELQKRNVNNQEINEFHKRYLQEEETLPTTGKLYCPRCHSLSVRQVRPLWVLAIVPVLVYLLLPKYECAECGFSFRKSKKQKSDKLTFLS